MYFMRLHSSLHSLLYAIELLVIHHRPRFIFYFRQVNISRSTFLTYLLWAPI